MLKRVERGLETSASLLTLRPARVVKPFSEENLALDVIAEAGPGGMYMDKLHTLEQMRTAALLPEIANREPRQQWEEGGALDAQARAMRRVREILTRDNLAAFSPDVDARIRAEFENLVAGDATSEWPSG